VHGLHHLKQEIGKLLAEGSDEETHRARLLMMVGLVFVTAGMVVSVLQVILSLHPAFPPAPGIDLAMDALVVAIGGLVVWLVRLGRSRSATWVVLFSFLAVAVTVLYVQGDPTADVAGGLGLVLVATLAFVLLDWRIAAVLATVVAISYAAIHVLWLVGRLPPPIARDPASEAGFSIVTWLAVGGTIAAVVSSTMGMLRKHREHLEEMVDERTRVLQETQEQLLRQDRLAVLGKLAGGVAHELRQPLEAIKNAAYLIRMELDEPDRELAEVLDILDNEVRVSQGIINGLLDLGRRRRPQRGKLDVNELVQAAISRVDLPENVHVETQLDRNLPPIAADAGQLTQVLNNLIQNAVEAMPEGGHLTARTAEATVRPRGRKTGAMPREVVISIADTGVGVPVEDREKVFEPLFTTKTGGIGLGLAIVTTLVEGHRGTVELESKPGEGSVFSVRLPVDINLQSSLTTRDSRWAGSRRVLVVDDDAGMVRTTAMILGRKGYAVTTAVDGLEAVELAKEQPFDLVLTDLKMPHIDGVETYRRIKMIQPGAAVMMMTAYGVDELVQQAVEEGAYCILSKPLDMETVVSAIEAATQGRE
jgi:signal transduction histidine kinase